MPSEIGASRPLPALTPARVTQSAAEISLKLAQSLGDLLPTGQSASAEVLAVREAPFNFQLLLRLTLASGQQALVTADSAQPLPKGSNLTLSAVSPTSLAATLLAPSSSAIVDDLLPLASLDLEQLPVGSLVQGKVLSSTALPAEQTQTSGYRVLLRLLGGPLAGRLLDLDSARPLKPGSLLSAQVQDTRALQFLPLSERLDQLNLSRQLIAQQGRQTPPQALIETLQTLTAHGEDLPAPLRGAVNTLLASLPDIHQLSDAKGLAQALQQSGSFLEGRLLQGVAPQASDYKANLLRLISELLPVAGDDAPGLLANLANNSAANLVRSLPAFVRNALGTLSQNGSPRVQHTDFPLPPRTLQKLEDEGDLESLLKLASAAVARLQTHQLSSLVQSEPLPDGGQLNTWQMEIPMRQQQSVIPLQVRIQQEERHSHKDQEQARESLWRIDLAFDLDPLGPLQVQATLASIGLSSQLWAERDSTAQLIDRELGHLRQRLQDAGLTVRELSCRQGRPPQGARTALEQRWVDETA